MHFVTGSLFAKKKESGSNFDLFGFEEKNQIFIMFFCPFAGSQKIA